MRIKTRHNCLMHLSQLILLVLLGLSLAACNQDPHLQPVLKVGSREIGKQEVRLNMAYMGLGGEPRVLTQDLRKAALDAVAQRYLIIHAAQDSGVKLEEEELIREENLLRGQMAAEEFEKALNDQGLEYAQWREILAGELLARKMLDLIVTSQVRVSVDEIKQYYENNREEFRHPDQILALHVVLPSKELAKKLLSSLKSGKDIGEACVKLGITPPGDGEPVWLDRGHMPKSLERKVFALRPKRLGGPYKSDYGYHVIKVLDKRKAGISSLAQATEAIQRRLIDERKQELAARWINELNRKTEVWFDPGFIKDGRSTGS